MGIRNVDLRRGMAATEYIIGLVLVAVAAVGVFSVFGQQIKAKVAQTTGALSGDDKAYKDAQDQASKLGGAANARAATKNSMKGEDSANMVIQGNGSQGAGPSGGGQ